MLKGKDIQFKLDIPKIRRYYEKLTKIQNMAILANGKKTDRKEEYSNGQPWMDDWPQPPTFTTSSALIKVSETSF